MKSIRNTFGPLFLILTCPPFAMVMWHTNVNLQGSFSELYHVMMKNGFFQSLYAIWKPVFFGSPTAWIILSIFIVFEFLLAKILKGKTFYGPVTPKGNVPVYKANGVMAFLVTIFTFCVTSFYLQLFPATIIYDHFGEILGALNCLSLVVCALFYIKGRFWPSSSDAGLTGNFIFDYYWGTELYPSLWGINLKMFINCRLGMMSWGLILLSYAAKQQTLFGLSNAMVIAVALQFIYISKFFIWETGYLASLDIMHDRAGFYICWGCLVWVPCIYTSPTMYLVLHPHHLNGLLAAAIFIAGTLSIVINYLADRQRQRVRATAGDCKIWGKKPRVTVATYYTESGERKQNLLLSSGWWGISRHFHYLPEIAAAFFWSVPALFNHFAPYFYVCFLSILLLDRAFRDDKRCYKKYGEDWKTYCDLVPYKMIPYLL
ncbi:7-dehydrocholesterol reductase (7-DHC reductase) (Sterol Delta(7)-reductase) (protein DWARF 5) [Legionella lansingensis]|uniref:7-dehydrocholesterol reductase n=1 Tax=Legionella lansingensis TaxID=45067 RepID=A0A0W0VZ21_9GAMM|nr:7-dehydrocholesterol reductase [Legionella lansingensis]KTD25413.1 7-dehydrocholesterol reductase [Legionella lansingensis]SNV51399.1 7-dehydrocholesterol reductase (7-DHC reductase) (Sterol Delta(7)-reductase) (protein DWARF 5) [Legionella lansingensis]